ncbi:MAG: hypothetical protein WCL57_15040 [Chloroflexota bacterium]
MSDYSEDDPNPSRKYIFGKPLKPGQITFGEYSKTPEGQAFLEEIADLIKNVVDGINDDPVNQSNLAKLKLMLDSSDPHDRVFAKYILDSPIENIYEFRQAFLDEIQNVKLPPEMRPDDPTGKNDPRIDGVYRKLLEEIQKDFTISDSALSGRVGLPDRQTTKIAGHNSKQAERQAHIKRLLSEKNYTDDELIGQLNKYEIYPSKETIKRDRSELGLFKRKTRSKAGK